jgi:hypothetical protein
MVFVAPYDPDAADRLRPDSNIDAVAPQPPSPNGNCPCRQCVNELTAEG